ASGTPTPADPQLPTVEIIQAPQAAPKAAPKSAAKKKAPAPTPVVSPQPLPPTEDLPEQEFDAASSGHNPIYGSPAAAGAAARAEVSAQTPVNPTSLIPTSLEQFSSSATHISPELLTERQPRNVNEALTRVPGVLVINDDADAHHGGIGIRGAPPRRSR